MQAECVFPRLVELIQTPSVQEDTRLHQMLLELMYESSRIQRLSWEDLSESLEQSQTAILFPTLA